jgi:hypothetical protein
MLAPIRPRPIIPSCIWDLLFRENAVCLDLAVTH